MSVIEPEAVKARIDDFWQWFSKLSAKIADLEERSLTDSVAELIQPRIEALQCGLGWEVGPDDACGLFLAFTLKGDRENLSAAQTAVDAAPVLDGWSFYIGKPPRKWDGRFDLINRQGREVELDASSWSYVLTSYDNNRFFDIELLAECLPSMDEQARKQAALLVTEMLVGEVMALDLIGDAYLTTPIPPDLAERATPIHHLKDHLESIVSGDMRQ